MRRRQFAFALLGSGLVGCGGSDVQTLPFRQLDQDLSPWEPSTYVFRDQASWNAAWNARAIDDVSSIPAPLVDFAKEVVIGVSEGEATTYGEWLEPVQVTREGTTVEFQYRRARSAPSMGPAVSAVLCVFLAIPRPADVVRFVKV